MQVSAVALAAAVALVAGSAQVGAATSAPSGQRRIAGASPVTVALLGDTPYSASDRRRFPKLVKAINAAPAVSMVLHAGDIKSGDSRCSTRIYKDRRHLFNTFADPFMLTPGDNDWTDCHTLSAGRYLPTERLATLRRVMFPRPGTTLGRAPITVQTQARFSRHPRYRENVIFRRADVVFATVHVVGSSNDRRSWSGLSGGDREGKRTAEFRGRDAADRAWVERAFDLADSKRSSGVVLLMQAQPQYSSAFADVRRKIVRRSTQFGRPVLLIHGNEHQYEVQRQFAGVPRLTRLETFGATATKWLRLRVDPSTSKVFSWNVRQVG